MVLLLHENLANLFHHRVSPGDSHCGMRSLIANGLVFIIEIKPEHVFRIFLCPYRFGGDHQHFAQIVDLPREDQGVVELLFGVYFELRGDVHVFGAFEHRGIDHLGDNRLIFARKVFVQ